MHLQKRIELLSRLGQYMQSNESQWLQAKLSAEKANSWFTQAFIEKAYNNIVEQFLDYDKLTMFAKKYSLPQINAYPKLIGLVMAGNIPLVGFHDWMCIFLTGHRALIKASSKDDMLIRHLVEVVKQWETSLSDQSNFAEILKGCNAYIATGSNNSGRYFDYYFSRYPHLIRRNRSSVAVLTGKESQEALHDLADDIHVYFGLGCRNVTKIYVPSGYDFVPLLDALKKYSYFIDHHKYKNNYDYQLAIHMLNNSYYMTNGSILLIEEASVFSPISQLNYAYYVNPMSIEKSLPMEDIQCIVGEGYTSFGQAQCPTLTDFADGSDTMLFLTQLTDK